MIFPDHSNLSDSMMIFPDDQLNSADFRSFVASIPNSFSGARRIAAPAFCSPWIRDLLAAGAAAAAAAVEDASADGLSRLL